MAALCRRSVIVLLTAAVIGCVSSSSPIPDTPVMIDLTPRPITVLPPGTIIGDGPPEGWTHLVIKSRSRVHSGDVDQLDDALRRLTALLSSAMVVRVEAGPPYRLADIAFGITASIQGQDTVISSGSQAKLGAKLGFLERLGLSRAEARLPGLLTVARSDTMILVDAPTQLLRDGKHIVVIFRTAILLDPKTDQVETMMWAIDRDEAGDYITVSSDVIVMPPNLQEEILLHVDAGEFVFGMITEKALAMPHLPEGRKRLAMTENLKPIAGLRRLSATECEQLQKDLRKLRED